MSSKKIFQGLGLVVHVVLGVRVVGLMVHGVLGFREGFMGF